MITGRATGTAASLRNPSFAQVWRFLAVALPTLAALLVPMPSIDLTYHLRAGAEILAGRGIPSLDTWTFTASNTPWLDQQWGAQVLLSAVYEAAGWTGLAVLRAALVALTFGLLLVTVRAAWSRASIRAGGSAVASSARTATLVVLLAFAVAAPALALRPQLFAIVLFVATMLILVERADHPRRLWLVPVVAALWANLHGSFPLVVVLVGLAWLDEVTLLREPPSPGRASHRLPQRLLGSTGLAIVGAVSALATLLTPFGIDAWRYVENLARDPDITTRVAEWQPPSPLDPTGALFYVSLLLVLGVVAFRFRSDKGRPPLRFLAPLVSVVLFGTLGILTGRGLAWWALIAPVAVVSLQPGLKLADLRLRGVQPLRARTAREAAAGEARRSPINAWLMVVLVLAGVVLLPTLRDKGADGVPNGTLSYAPQGISAELRELLAHHSVQCNAHVWNPQPLGSWLEFAVPELSYSVDSRIELFPEQLWADADTVASANGDWQSVLATYPIDVIVVDWNQTTLYDGLRASNRWMLRAAAEEEGWIFLRASGDAQPTDCVAGQGR